MRKVVMFLIILSVFVTGAEAHDGSIGIYTSALADDCDADIPPYAAYPLYIVYFKSDTGPDGITGAEFKAEIDKASVNFGTFTCAAGAIATGSIDAGIAVVFTGGCTGSGASTVHIGTIEVFSFAIFDWTMHIVANPASAPEPGIWISQCGEFAPVAPVLGGWFHEGEGACNLAGESSSWGAIKSIYTE